MLYRELNGAPAPCRDLPVNDLTSMVAKKKKKVPAPAPESSGAAEKLKAEDEEAETAPDKKALQENAAP